ncbi:prepilin peptidase [Pseudokineococcus lusitanus]|uniref:Prepilin leader peptidase/N-methyltransferase n=1 Tax=Pseudokineococcus lusitanus TaxID=763993 RepID=A0A3N1G991_9ACTN|nr:A24 family peptidase [Pseudokineococcus lusitanus]ROP26829.1 type 4 prepilin peptidase 1 [Pseudokineococcus lusitanus]
MTTVLVLACGLLGLLVGSFLNVVVHRVPAGESVVAPPSACPRCGHRLRSRDNVPVLSWLVLRGRCRDCRAPISVRYPLVELGTAVLLALTAWHLGWSPVLPAFLYLGCVAVALAAIDLDTHRLPDAIVLPSYVVGAVLLLVAAAATGEWDALVRAAVGGAGLWLLYFGVAVARPGGMGFGDVKLAGLLGMHLAFLGWAELAAGAFAGFLVGGVVGVALLATRRAGRKTAVPYGPSMLVGAALGVAVGAPVAGAYLGLMGLQG